jgi:hypothetical protein
MKLFLNGKREKGENILNFLNDSLNEAKQNTTTTKEKVIILMRNTNYEIDRERERKKFAVKT